MNGEVGESVAVPSADELVGHLVNSAHKQERCLKGLVDGHGVTKARHHILGRGATIIGFHHYLDEHLPFDLIGPLAGMLTRKPDPLSGLSRCAQPESTRWLSRNLVNSGEADNVRVLGRGPKNAVAGAAD
jgi:hypothetical protein